MDALLDHVIAAHGGLDQWKNHSTLTARVTYGGPFWEFKGNPDFAGSYAVEADLQKQHFRQVQEATGRTVVFSKLDDRVSLSEADGTVVDELDGPRATFDGYAPDTQWSLAQEAYFSSYAVWHYLLEPYLFAWPGVEAHEVEPWTEGDTVWRGLSVTFPESVDTHNTTESYYFDDAGLLRRMDYAPEVNGRPPVAHYVRQQDSFHGIVVPTERHVHGRNEDGTPDLSAIPITVDVGGVEFH
ncbi:hypothetical protein [Streptomyces fructofermentans]|uniref:hypothetical protein n=1 Tax=Streptomyces fructofermentans TaxID=152141 RepID=UPI0037ABC1B8